MKIFTAVLSLAAVSAVTLSQAAIAAPNVATVKLAQVQGDVMVNTGSRFVKAVSGLELKPGAKIVTAKESNVSLVYQNGCVKRVKQNTMLNIGSAEECVTNANKERIYVAAAVGDTQTDVPAGSAPKTQPFLGSPLSYVAGGLLVVGGAVALNNDSSNNNNSSPQ